MSNWKYFINRHNRFYFGSVDSYFDLHKDKTNKEYFKLSLQRDDISGFMWATVLNGVFTQNQKGSGGKNTDSYNRIFRIRFVEENDNGEKIMTPTSFLPDPFSQPDVKSMESTIILHPLCYPEGVGDEYDISAGDLLKVYRRGDIYVYSKPFYKSEFIGPWAERMAKMAGSGGGAGAFGQGGGGTLGNQTDEKFNVSVPPNIKRVHPMPNYKGKHNRIVYKFLSF